MVPFSDSNNEFDVQNEHPLQAFDAWLLLPFISPKIKNRNILFRVGYASTYPDWKPTTTSCASTLPNVTIKCEYCYKK